MFRRYLARLPQAAASSRDQVPVSTCVVTTPAGTLLWQGEDWSGLGTPLRARPQSVGGVSRYETGPAIQESTSSDWRLLMYVPLRASSYSEAFLRECPMRYPYCHHLEKPKSLTRLNLSLMRSPTSTWNLWYLTYIQPNSCLAGRGALP